MAATTVTTPVASDSSPATKTVGCPDCKVHKAKIQILKQAVRQLQDELAKTAKAEEPSAAAVSAGDVPRPASGSVVDAKDKPEDGAGKQDDERRQLMQENSALAESIKTLKDELEASHAKLELVNQDRAVLWEKLRVLEEKNVSRELREMKIFEPTPIVEEIFEHQKYYPLKGWAPPLKRHNWGDATGKTKKEKETFDVPAGWRWFDAWKVQGGANTDQEGWQYCTMIQRKDDWHAIQKPLDMMRRRRWVRTRVQKPPA